MPTPPTFSTNAFDNTNPARGMIAESVRDQAISGVLGGSDALLAGARVKLDSTNTVPGKCVFVAAADNEAAVGTIKFNAKQDTFAVGDTLEVTYSGGLAVYQVGSTTLTPGTPVALSSGYLAAVDGSHLQMGLLIDYVVVSGVGRVIIGWVAA